MSTRGFLRSLLCQLFGGGIFRWAALLFFLRFEPVLISQGYTREDIVLHSIDGIVKSFFSSLLFAMSHWLYAVSFVIIRALLISLPDVIPNSIAACMFDPVPSGIVLIWKSGLSKPLNRSFEYVFAAFGRSMGVGNAFNEKNNGFFHNNNNNNNSIDDNFDNGVTVRIVRAFVDATGGVEPAKAIIVIISLSIFTTILRFIIFSVVRYIHIHITEGTSLSLSPKTHITSYRLDRAKSANVTFQPALPFSPFDWRHFCECHWPYGMFMHFSMVILSVFEGTKRFDKWCEAGFEVQKASKVPLVMLHIAVHLIFVADKYIRARRFKPVKVDSNSKCINNGNNDNIKDKKND